MLRLFTLLCAILGAQTGIAGTHTIDLKNFAQPGRNCDQDIASVAQAFLAAAPAAELVSSACVGPSLGETAAAGRIVYLADEAVETESSDVFEASGIDGYFPDRESCELALQHERPLFTAHVGSEPFVAYCYVASDYGAPRYRSRMDAVGRFGSYRKFVTSARLQNLPTDVARFERAAHELLCGTPGLEVAALGVGYAPGGWRLSADYYAEKQLQLHVAMNFAWRTPEACDVAMQELQNQWAQHDDVSPGYFQCLKPSGSKGARGAQVVLLGTGARDRVALNVLPKPFTSESDCVAELFRVRELYNSKGQKVYAAACGLDEYQKNYLLGLWL